MIPNRRPIFSRRRSRTRARSESCFLRQPRFESLENRRMLTASVGIVPGEVFFEGDLESNSLMLTVDDSGHLTHDLPLQENLVSPADLDSATPGEQIAL